LKYTLLNDFHEIIGIKDIISFSRHCCDYYSYSQHYSDDNIKYIPWCVLLYPSFSWR